MHKAIMRSWAVFAFIGSLLLSVAAHAQVVPTGASSLNSGTISAGGLTPSSGPGSGDVVGPASAVSTSLPTYSGTTGKLIAAGSGLTVPVSGTLNLGILNATGLVTAVGVTTTGQIIYSGVSVDVTTGTNEDFTITPNGTGSVVLGKGAVFSGPATDITTGTNETLVVDTNGTGVVQLNDQLVLNAVTTDIVTGTNEDLTVTPNGTGVIVAGKSITAQGSTGVTFSGSTTDITTGTNETLVVDTNGTGVIQFNDQQVSSNVSVDVTTGTNEDYTITPNGTGVIVAGKSITATGTTGITFSGSTTDVTTGTNEDYTVSPNGTGVAIFGKSVTLQGTTGATFSGSTTDITTGTNETLVIDTNGTGVVQFNDQVVSNAVTTDVTTGTNEDYTITPNGTGSVVAGKALVVSGVTNDITTGTNEDLRIAPNGSGSIALRSGTTNQLVMERGSGTQMLIFDVASAEIMRSSGNDGAILVGNAALGHAFIGAAQTDIGAGVVVGGVADTMLTASGGSKVALFTVLGEGLVAVARRQSASCTDNAGAGGVLGGLTLTPTSSAVYVTNTDAQGCIVTLAEPAAGTLGLGADIEIVVVANTGGTVTFPAVANIHAGPTFATTTGLGLNDSYNIHYADMADDILVGVSVSDN